MQTQAPHARFSLPPAAYNYRAIEPPQQQQQLRQQQQYQRNLMDTQQLGQMHDDHAGALVPVAPRFDYVAIVQANPALLNHMNFNYIGNETFVRV